MLTVNEGFRSKLHRKKLITIIYLYLLLRSWLHDRYFLLKWIMICQTSGYEHLIRETYFEQIYQDPFRLNNHPNLLQIMRLQYILEFRDFVEKSQADFRAPNLR